MAELKDVRNDYYPVDTATLETNVALLAFKVASGDSLSTFQMVDQVIDEFVDAAGVDAGTSTNANIGGGYYSGVAEGGYFGSGTDGALTTTGNVTHTVQNKYGAYDGDMVVKNYGDLTISAGHTMTVDQPCRGMLIYVDGDCTINGTLTMLGKGANAQPAGSGGAGASHADGLMISYKKVGGVTLTSGSDLSGCGPAAIAAVANHPTSGNGYVLQIPRVGGSGGATRSSSGGGNAGNVGDSGMNGTISTIYKQLSFGGGGSGGAYWDGNSCGGGDAISGRGGHSTCWSGGTGGGGKMSGGSATGGDDAGGQGGQGHNNHCGGTHSASGGMGNPCGLDVYSNSNSTTQYTGASGTGGLLILMVRGNLTVGASGIITTEGVANSNSGRSLPGGCYGSGGSSGGGALAVLHGGTYSDSGSVTSAGGVGVNHGTGTGGAGGDGGQLIEQVITSIEGDMSLVSNTSTAEATPTVGDIVMLMEDGVGTATINTDIIAYISRDAGTNWSSAVTLVDEGNWGTNKKILVARNVDISSLAGTTSMRYKIDTANQSTTLDTRVHAVSLAWK